MSAGADPGPAAYGRGESATVTDADLLLGYIPADYFLGGEIDLDVGRSADALGRVGAELGLTPEETALAVFETVNALMAGQITEVCTKRGYDVRDFTIVAGGGAGGLHAAAIAARLSIPEVIIPRVSALMSAFGMFTMGLGQEYARTRFRDLGRADAATMEAVYAEMRAEAEAAFARVGIGSDALRFVATVDIRYAGQFHEVEIELPPGEITDEVVASLASRFHKRYEALYGYQLPYQPVEFLSLYLKVTSPQPPLALAEQSVSSADVESARRGTRVCRFPAGAPDVPVYDGDRLGPGHSITGPALVDDPTTTVLVVDGFECTVDPQRNLLLRAARGPSTNDRRRAEGAARASS
jgi:N-methylhydantoinase A